MAGLRIAIGALAEPPLPGRCLAGLLAAHSADWVAGLHAAMLRDTLDGLQSLDAREYLVLTHASDDEALRALERHVPAPWVVVACATHEEARARVLQGAGSGGLALLARSDAPAAPIDRLVALASSATPPPSLAVLGASEGGDAWLVGARGAAHAELTDLPWATPELAATMRVRCSKREVPLHELDVATLVSEPSGVLALLDELRRHPERAPRAAHFVVTHG